MITTTTVNPGNRVMSNGIIVYHQAGTSDLEAIEQVAQSYPTIFRDSKGVVDIPKEEWMPIWTLPDAIPTAAKVYTVGEEDRQFIDKEFNKLHKDGKMSWTTNPTPFGYPVFVVWRTTNSAGKEPQQKGRVVVDIQGLNKMTKPYSYPMPLQSDVTSLVQGHQSHGWDQLLSPVESTMQRPS